MYRERGPTGCWPEVLGRYRREPDEDAPSPALERRPAWDYNTAAGKEHLLVYRQTLLAGLKAAARWPTDLVKVYDVRQGADESPAAFLERK